MRGDVARRWRGFASPWIRSAKERDRSVTLPQSKDVAVTFGGQRRQAMLVKLLGRVLGEPAPLPRDWWARIPAVPTWENPELYLAMLGVEEDRRADVSVRENELCATSTAVITINQ
jgi:hypothetical protein